MPVAVGQRVEAGQVVVQLDTAVADAELEAAKASRRAAEAAGFLAATRLFRKRLG